MNLAGLYPGCWIWDIYINLQKFLSSSYCSAQICCPMKGAGTGWPDLQHCTHCAGEFALPALAACHKPFPAPSCLDLIKDNESFNHGDSSPYHLRQLRTNSVGQRKCAAQRNIKVEWFHSEAWKYELLNSSQHTWTPIIKWLHINNSTYICMFIIYSHVQFHQSVTILSCVQQFKAI